MNTRKLALWSGLTLIALVGLVIALQAAPAGADDDARTAYEAMLAAHPYANRPPMDPAALRAIPKKDRPDLAAEQQFLLTMDPATGTVPIERLFEANRIARRLQEEAELRGGGPLVTESWGERGPTFVGGRTRALMYDPNDPAGKKVWAGGVAGGLWYINDITSVSASWANVDDFWPNLAVSAITYDPTDPQVMYVGTGEGYFNIDAVRGAGIFKSTNGGEDWTLLPSTENPSFHYTQRLIVHPTTGDVYAATSLGVYRSQDGGTAWEQVLVGGAGRDLEIATNGTLYAGLVSGRVYGSATGATGSWTQLNTGANGMPNIGLQRIELATTPADPLVVYALAQGSGNGVSGIYRSADGGATWTARALPFDADPGIGGEFSRGQAWYDLSIAADPNSADVAFVGGVDLFKTTDGAASWRQISHWYGGFGFPNVHADQHAIAFKPGSSDEIVFSHDGGVTYTANGSQVQPTMQKRVRSYNVTQFYAGAISPDAGSNVMLAGAQDNGTQRYSSPGAGVTTEVNGGDGGFTFFDQTDSNNAVASYVFNNFYRSTNNGNNFNVTLLSENSGQFINPADLDDREDILYTYKSQSELFRVSDVFGTPQATALPVTLIGTMTNIKVSPFSAPGTSTVFAGINSGRIFRIDDAHATPTVTELTAPSGGGAISSIEFGATEDEMIVTRSNYGVVSVFESLDGGATWANKEGNLPDMPVRWALYHPLDPNGVLLATEAGVWETANFRDASPTWTPAPGFPIVSTHMLQYRVSDGTVMAATHGRGSFTAQFQGFGTANEGVAGGLVGTHRLALAGPNPFRGQTRLTLAVATPQRVRMTLLDARGRRVRTVHDGTVAVGAAQAVEVAAQGLPSGAYVVAVEGETFRDRLRLTLVR